MVKARRVTCVITARPSYARIKTALLALQDRVQLSVVCVASALLDRYGNIHEQIRADGFDVPFVSYSQIEGDHGAVQARTLALSTLDLATYFAQTRPAAVITVADRYETLATAVAASYQSIPLVHVQGGEVTGSIDDKVRNAVTQLADLHLVSTDAAADRVWQMRPDADPVVTGCPSLDLAAAVTGTIRALPGTGDAVDLSQPFILALFHPVTDEADRAGAQTKALQRALNQTGLPVVWFWPNVDSGSERVAKALRTWTPSVPVHFVRQVPPDDFIRLMRQCTVMVGNSSAGIREGSFLGAPVVNIGTRQRGRTRGPNVRDVANYSSIAEGIAWWRQQPRPQPSTLYGDGRSGQRIADAVCTWLTGRQTARRVA